MRRCTIIIIGLGRRAAALVEDLAELVHDLQLRLFSASQKKERVQPCRPAALQPVPQEINLLTSKYPPNPAAFHGRAFSLRRASFGSYSRSSTCCVGFCICAGSILQCTSTPRSQPRGCSPCCTRTALTRLPLSSGAALSMTRDDGAALLVLGASRGLVGKFSLPATAVRRHHSAWRLYVCTST